MMESAISVLTHITWPVAVLIIFIVLLLPIWSLLKCLIEACGKADKFELGSFKLSSRSSPELGDENSNDTKYLEMLKAFDSETIKNKEREIRRQLSESKCSSKRATDILISQLANRVVLTHLLFINRSILEPQTSILVFLNTKRGRHTIEPLNKYFEDYIKLYDEQKFKDLGIPKMTVDQFIAFLIVNRLIDHNMQGFSITSLGIDYLGFIVRLGQKLPVT